MLKLNHTVMRHGCEPESHNPKLGPATKYLPYPAANVGALIIRVGLLGCILPYLQKGTPRIV